MFKNCEHTIRFMMEPCLPAAANRFQMSAADQRKLNERSSRFKSALDSANSQKKVSLEDLFKNAVSAYNVDR